MPQKQVTIDVENVSINKMDPSSSEEEAERRERYWIAQINRFGGKKFSQTRKIKRGNTWIIRVIINPEDSPEYNRFISNMRSLM